MPNEEEELRELKSMFARRPAWDSTPLRNRPPALVGLKPVTREPWAIDEDVYNRRFETRDVGVPGARVRIVDLLRMPFPSEEEFRRITHANLCTALTSSPCSPCSHLSSLTSHLSPLITRLCLVLPPS
jgi:hypothetical protein